jgi:hypothetical protein
MDTGNEIRGKLGDEWLPAVYRDKIRTQRTRAYRIDIPERENRVSVQHTLLGIELKIGKKRFSCPDLSTARYLQIFARMGCREFAIPYDITRISSAADELESSWQKALLHLEEAVCGKAASVRGRIRSGVIRLIRNEVSEIGAGALMPEFSKTTKQRNS